MRIEVTTHNEILTDPIVELDRTIDDPKNQTFQPIIILTDKDNPLRKFGQFLQAQPYVNGTWSDEYVENAIQNYIKSIEVK